MKLFTWIKGLLQPQGDTIRVNSLTMPLAKWEAMRTPPQAAPVPAEMPSDELMSRWREECRQLSADSDYEIPASSFMAQRVVAWTRQQQAESFQLSPPGADPVATDEELLRVARYPVWFDEARRALYNRGRLDERAAIAKELGVEL